jgi:hypothetical protein
MSYKHVGTAADLVRFGCSLRVECSACAAANTLRISSGWLRHLR